MYKCNKYGIHLNQNGSLIHVSTSHISIKIQLVLGTIDKQCESKDGFTYVHWRKPLGYIKKIFVYICIKMSNKYYQFLPANSLVTKTYINKN